MHFYSAGILVGVPLLAGFILSRIVADPIFYIVEQRVPLAFAPTDAQKVSSKSRPRSSAAMLHKQWHSLIITCH